MSEVFGRKEERKQRLKEMIKRLHRGERAEDLKEEFKGILEGLEVMDIVQVEEELIREGIPGEEVRKLCDVHLAIFRESLEKGTPTVPAWHPVSILMEEHKMLLRIADELGKVVKSLQGRGTLEGAEEDLQELKHIDSHLKESESHLRREENILFPYLEKHGVTQPPAIMWMEHDQLREIKKGISDLLESLPTASFPESIAKLGEQALALNEMLFAHIYKENNILFPTALKVVGEEEWRKIRQEMDEFGYCCFTPAPASLPQEAREPQVPGVEGRIVLETGNLSPEELEGMLNALPFEITFVDKDDEVRYFNQPKERFFPRAKAIIGRKVQQCHPQKSVHLVNRILDDFRQGRREVAEFWIQTGGRFLHIRYFPVRNSEGEYIGCLEVTQDITEIKKLEGEKRLLEEER